MTRTQLWPSPSTDHMRVVLLTCSNTEIVCRLGSAELLVGVEDVYANTQSIAQARDNAS
ncbi:MAG: hypothetical protein NXI31_02845 [bacterium]|nr:hypothetical protein [bacterium]